MRAVHTKWQDLSKSLAVTSGKLCTHKKEGQRQQSCTSHIIHSCDPRMFIHSESRVLNLSDNVPFFKILHETYLSQLWLRTFFFFISCSCGPLLVSFWVKAVVISNCSLVLCHVPLCQPKLLPLVDWLHKPGTTEIKHLTVHNDLQEKPTRICAEIPLQAALNQCMDTSDRSIQQVPYFAIVLNSLCKSKNSTKLRNNILSCVGREEFLRCKGTTGECIFN